MVTAGQCEGESGMSAEAPDPPPRSPKAGRDLRAAIGVGVVLGAAIILSLLMVRFVFIGIVAAIGDAPVAVVNHVAFVCDDHHCVILRSEGPDQRVHIVLNPMRQVAPNGQGYRCDGGIKVEMGVHVLKVTEDTRKSTPK